MVLEISRRLKKLPPYLFVEIDRAKKTAIQSGRDVIDLGIGDPDQPTPKFIIEALHRATLNPKNHRYALDRGLPELRIEIARWYSRRFGVELDPDREILPLIGSKEGIAHIPLAFINPQDIALVPEPCYPPYKSGVILAGGEICIMPLLEKNMYLPELKSIKHHILSRTKLMFLNYPNNPTSAICGKSFFREVIKFAKKHNIIVCHDAAYSEISFDGFRPPSFLQEDGAKEVGVEFHSFSKIFNMTGWRLGFICGNAKIIDGLARVKSNIDSGIFNAIQIAGVEALKNIDMVVARLVKVYQKRRDIFVEGLERIGWRVKKPKATFYVWMPVFKRHTSITLAKLLLDRADVVVTPGVGFGESGEGYVRMALTIDKSRLKEVVDRLARIL